MNEDITNYPLSWPVNQARTDAGQRKRAAFSTRNRGFSYGPSRKHSIAESAHELEAEIRRMGGNDMIISSNLKVKSNGMPYSAQRTPDEYIVADGAVGQRVRGDKGDGRQGVIPMPEEIDFFRLCGMEWIEPSERVARWKR